MLIAPGGHEGFSGTPLWKIREQRRPQWSAAALGSSLVFFGFWVQGLRVLRVLRALGLKV